MSTPPSAFSSTTDNADPAVYPPAGPIPPTRPPLTRPPPASLLHPMVHRHPNDGQTSPAVPLCHLEHPRLVRWLSLSVSGDKPVFTTTSCGYLHFHLNVDRYVQSLLEISSPFPFSDLDAIYTDCEPRVPNLLRTSPLPPPSCTSGTNGIPISFVNYQAPVPFPFVSRSSSVPFAPSGILPPSHPSLP